MKLVPVNEVQMRHQKSDYKNVSEWIMKFLALNVEAARVDFEGWEFCNTHSCMCALRRSIRENAFPVKITERNNNVYLIRTDREG